MIYFKEVQKTAPKQHPKRSLMRKHTPSITNQFSSHTSTAWGCCLFHLPKLIEVRTCQDLSGRPPKESQVAKVRAQIHTGGPLSQSPPSPMQSCKGSFRSSSHPDDKTTHWCVHSPGASPHSPPRPWQSSLPSRGAMQAARSPLKRSLCDSHTSYTYSYSPVDLSVA